MTRSSEYYEDGRPPRRRMTTAELADQLTAERRVAALAAARAKNRAAFEEHHALAKDRSLIGRIKDAAHRLRREGSPLKRRRKVKTAGERRDFAAKAAAEALKVAENIEGEYRPLPANHVLVPVAALNKASAAEELNAASLYIQGYVLANRQGVATYGRGPARAPILVTAERRAQLIAMYGYVDGLLQHEHRQMLDAVTGLTLRALDGRLPTISEIGAQITSSDDERVRKGGVIGYWRCLFQVVRELQRQYAIEETMRRMAARREIERAGGER